MEYCVYILQSLSYPTKIYTGFTSHLILRMNQHNISDFDKTAYTKKFRPWVVIHTELFDNKSDALKREKWLKSGIGRQWIAKNILEA